MGRYRRRGKDLTCGDEIDEPPSRFGSGAKLIGDGIGKSDKVVLTGGGVDGVPIADRKDDRTSGTIL